MKQRRLWLCNCWTIDCFCSVCDVRPMIHGFDSLMERERIDLSRLHLANRFDKFLFDAFNGWRCIANHVVWKNFRNASDFCAHHEKSTTRRFGDCNAKGFGERAVQENVSADNHVACFCVRNGAEHLNAILKLVLLTHLFEVEALFAISSNNPMHLWKACADLRNDADDKIESFAIRKTAQDDNGDFVFIEEKSIKVVIIF